MYIWGSGSIGLDFWYCYCSVFPIEFLGDMAKYTPYPCPICGSVGLEPCIRGKMGSIVWQRQLPYSPGHSERWQENKKKLLANLIHNLWTHFGREPSTEEVFKFIHGTTQERKAIWNNAVITS